MSSIEELCNITAKNAQTLVEIGENHRISDYEKKELLRRTQFNRIVKGGRATLMNLEWDGYDIINMLTKHCEIHDG